MTDDGQDRGRDSEAVRADGRRGLRGRDVNMQTALRQYLEERLGEDAARYVIEFLESPFEWCRCIDADEEGPATIASD